MKATGIVRRIDELGRIVIPKEIRKTLRIREGDSLEIFIDNQENIVLKKYSLMNKINDFAQDFTDSIHSFVKNNIIITDTDNIIAVSGSLKKEFINQPLSENLINSIKRRESMLEKHEKSIVLSGDKEVNGTYAISTIVANGDAVGLVIVIGNEDKVTESDHRITQIAAQFLAKHIEE